MKKKERRKLKQQQKEYEKYQERANFVCSPSRAFDVVRAVAKKTGLEVNEKSLGEWEQYINSEEVEN